MWFLVLLVVAIDKHCPSLSLAQAYNLATITLSHFIQMSSLSDISKLNPCLNNSSISLCTIPSYLCVDHQLRREVVNISICNFLVISCIFFYILIFIRINLYRAIVSHHMHSGPHCYFGFCLSQMSSDHVIVSCLLFISPVLDVLSEFN